MDLDDTASSQPQRRTSNEAQSNSQALKVAPSSSRGKKTRMSGGSQRSDVWEGFTKLEILNPDNTVRVEQVQCKLCHQILAYSSGTSSLRYHLSTHEKRAHRFITNRVVSSSVPSYDHANARRALVKFIAATDQHLGLGSNPHFVAMIREGFNSNYEPVSRSTVVQDLIDLYERDRKNHVANFASSPDNNVAIAIDIWRGGNKQDYLSVTVHCIDKEYRSYRKLVGFELFDGKNVSDCVSLLAEDWSFANRVVGITMDKKSYDDTTIEELRKKLKSNVGGEILHQRCAVDIINVMVQAGLEAIAPMLEDIRYAVTYVNTPSQRVNRWKLKCRENKMEECIIAHDIPSQWSSTYVMLERILPYSKVFTIFVYDELKGEGKNLVISDQHWVVARAIFELLKVLYNWTIHISASEVPTSHLAIHMVYEISIAFQECKRDHSLIEEAVTAMVKVWENYFWPMPMLYCYAFILDPRIRIDGLASWFTMLKSSSKLDYGASLEEARESVFRAYRSYEMKCVPRHVVCEDPCFTGTPVDISWQHFYQEKAKKMKLEEQSSSNNELKLYLKANFVDIEPINLDVLQWWRSHEAEFPILSIFAQDVLSVPAASVSSENAFCVAGRIMDDRVSQLRPKLVKILACVKDWEREKLKTPTEFSKDHNEWVEAFNEWNINDN